jgi:hypothetical protein
VSRRSTGAPRGRPLIVLPPAVVEGLRKLIAGRAGHPCPDNKLLAQALGVDLRTLRRAIDRLERAGQLEIERSAFIGGLRRRMRVKLRGRWRPWTELTRRHAYDLRITAPDLLRGSVHHLASVLMAGRYD